MDIEELKQSIKNLTIWKKGNQRAPHKPLLILYALGKLKSDVRLLPYKEVGKDLKQLLIEFGPLRKSYHPEEPFVRLTRDGIWELDAEVNFSDPRHRLLLDKEISGGFTIEVFNLLKQNLKYIPEIAQIILEQHFPSTFHDDILEAVGLDFNHSIKNKRDSKFRDKVLRAYGYSCAICGFNVRLAHKLVGIEAAHIKWHQAGGPDIEGNGLALCSLHHKLFDRGVFTINNDRRMIVSQDAHGTHGFEEWLMRYHGEVIREPIEHLYQPSESYIHWHVKEVFKGPERYIIS
ncbi:phosphorothioated DNA-binding restriction endonuclease [Salirhabdus sp. Marseille-P4669]|uniref:phosphorothioated DNA-binding restriction endonuclease n=1 Tax=Salirhabdus sp. Marseille-P4669 TaxID=2042310 RepID=UPI000C7E7D19|nr:HNH endonuclease [Salirhabdus sp. Marseille-P4669]